MNSTTAQASPRATNVMRGIGLRVCTALSFAFMAAFLKVGATRGASVTELIFYRAIFGLPIVLLWVFTTQGVATLAMQSPRAHLWRAVLGVSTMFIVFAALKMLPLAESQTLLFMGPIFATFLSWLFLKEKVGRQRLLAGLVGFLGVVVVMRPGASVDQIAPLGVAMGLLAAFGQACVNVTVRHIGATEHVAAIVFWFLVACAVASGVLLPIANTNPDATTLMFLAGAGFFGATGQLFMTSSLQHAPIAVLAPFDYLNLVMSMLLGWLLLDTLPTVYTYAGALLISGSGLYMLYREHRVRREAAVLATEPLV